MPEEADPLSGTASEMSTGTDSRVPCNKRNRDSIRKHMIETAKELPMLNLSAGSYTYSFHCAHLKPKTRLILLSEIFRYRLFRTELGYAAFRVPSAFRESPDFFPRRDGKETRSFRHGAKCDPAMQDLSIWLIYAICGARLDVRVICPFIRIYIIEYFYPDGWILLKCDGIFDASD